MARDVLFLVQCPTASSPTTTITSKTLLVRDMVTGSITLVSAQVRWRLSPTTPAGTGISPDGTSDIVFTSRASDLTPTISDDNGVQDIYIRDLVSGAIDPADFPHVGGSARVQHRRQLGRQIHPGRKIHRVLEHGIVPVTGTSEIMMKNLAQPSCPRTSSARAARGINRRRSAPWPLCGVRQRGRRICWCATIATTSIARIWRTAPSSSKNLSGYAGNGDSVKPQISADGRDVVFESDATSVVITASRPTCTGRTW